MFGLGKKKNVQSDESQQLAMEAGAVPKMKKEKKAEEKVKRSQKKEAIRNLVADIAPVIAVDARENAFYLSDGTVMDFFGIVTMDLVNIAEDTAVLNNFIWDKLYKTIEKPIKIISFQFPVNTKPQQDSIRRDMKRTDNPVFLDILQQQLNEAIYISEHQTEKEFCLFFYAGNVEALRETRNTIRSILSGNSANGSLVEPLDFEKKLDILYSLHNPTEILTA
jgi:hypothetical protein